MSRVRLIWYRTAQLSLLRRVGWLVGWLVELHYITLYKLKIKAVDLLALADVCVSGAAKLRDSGRGEVIERERETETERECVYNWQSGVERSGSGVIVYLFLRLHLPIYLIYSTLYLAASFSPSLRLSS
jgi:hypothetical protein